MILQNDGESRSDFHRYRLSQWEPVYPVIHACQAELLLRLRSWLPKMFPAFIMDWDHCSWIEHLDCAQGFPGVEREINGAGDRETCLPDVQNGSADLKTARDLLNAVEPNRITGDI